MPNSTTRSLSSSSLDLVLMINAVAAEDAAKTPQPSDQGRRTYPPPQYHWDLGNMRRACGGLCLCAPDWTHSLFVVLLFGGALAVFFSSIWRREDTVSPIVVPLLTAGSFICQFFAVTCDPGIYKKRVMTAEERDRGTQHRLQWRAAPAIQDGSAKGTEGPPSDDDHPFRLDFGRKETLLVNNGTVAVEMTMCTTCGIMKAPRSSHCATCNVCVDEFDHHCGVLGSCVARRTYRFFTGFLAFTCLLAMYVAAQTAVSCYYLPWSSLDTNLDRWRAAAAIGMLLFLAYMLLCGVAPMTCMYLGLACLNSSAKERNRPVVGSAVAGGGLVENPYRRNYVVDFFLRLCGPMPRSRLAGSTGGETYDRCD